MVDLEIIKFLEKFIERFPNYYQICRRRPNYIQKWQQKLLNAQSSNPFFLTIGLSNPQQFLHTIVNGMNLLRDETAFSKCVVFFRYYRIIATVCFYCTYELQNFIPKNLENALIKFVQTSPTSSRLWEVRASLSDFQKGLLVPRNPKQSKKLHDVITWL